jgi:GTPase
LEESKKKTGFVSLIGRPSSGKSTLINYICGYKISIVSSKPQTTQYIIRGIYNDSLSQIIFIDTPGYHNFNSNLNKGLTNLAVRTFHDGDLILYLIDTTRDFGREEEEIIGNLKKIRDKKIIAVYNKIDSPNSKLDVIKKEVELKLNPDDKIEVSAKDGTNIKELIQIIIKLLPFGELYYPEEYVTDQSIPFRIKEVVREKIINNTQDELPHSVYIEIENLEVNEKKIRAHAVIFVEKESQKGMIVGKNGAMIKKIGSESRVELEDILEKKVNLFCRVKVHHNWKKDEKFLKKLYNLENE